jgi:electron transport complex protein RnfB
MLEAVIAFVSLAVVCGLLLRSAATRRKTEAGPVAERINALLPQTQCRQCGFAGCRPYAEAIAAGTADINQCPPGGVAGIRALAKLLGREFKPLNPEYGIEKATPTVARIDEHLCIGCTLCIQACPVDAILGAAKQMHTIIEAECTGCELCIAPCPVDCIDMVPVQPDLGDRKWPVPWQHYRFFKAKVRGRGNAHRKADIARDRYEFRQFRLEREKNEQAAQRRQKHAALQQERARNDKKAAIAAALERVRQKKAERAARLTDPPLGPDEQHSGIRPKDT